jgi:hypothetical protein
LVSIDPAIDLEKCLIYRPPLTDAAIVDQNIDRAKAAFGDGKAGGEFGVSIEIEWENEQVFGGSGTGGGDTLKFRLAPCREDDASALATECPDEGLTDPRGSARDPDDFCT